jgi:tRNA threonylcarbamoyladenosine biosynthesis protein TsaB
VIVLGFDTATASTSVALRLADGSVSELRDDPPVGAHPGHATRLLDMANELLAGAGVGWREIERLAVGVGPGTFTGLRVGLATARGLAQSLSSQLVGVSSLQALAAAALADPAEDDPATVLAVIDARRGEVFAAVYERGEDYPPRELSGARALAPDDLASMVSALEQDAPSRRWLALGDGAIRFREDLLAAEIPTPPDSSPLHRLSAAAVCELGARQPVGGSLEEIVPDYRRRPDAELALETSAKEWAPES